MIRSRKLVRAALAVAVAFGLGILINLLSAQGLAKADSLASIFGGFLGLLGIAATWYSVRTERTGEIAEGDASRAALAAAYSALGAQSEVSEVDAALRMLGTSGIVAVIGSPGSGKTTLLTSLALRLLDSDEIPLLLRLSHFSAARPRKSDLFEWVTSEAGAVYETSPRVIERWIQQGRLVLLLDGLDEIPDSSGRATAVSQILAARNKVKVVLTSRPLSDDELIPLIEAADVSLLRTSAEFTSHSTETSLESPWASWIAPRLFTSDLAAGRFAEILLEQVKIPTDPDLSLNQALTASTWRVTEGSTRNIEQNPEVDLALLQAAGRLVESGRVPIAAELLGLLKEHGFDSRTRSLAGVRLAVLLNSYPNAFEGDPVDTLRRALAEWQNYRKELSRAGSSGPMTPEEVRTIDAMERGKIYEEGTLSARTLLPPELVDESLRQLTRRGYVEVVGNSRGVRLYRVKDVAMVGHR